jgi:hypothetical protein
LGILVKGIEVRKTKQNLKQCKQLRKHYLQTEKQEKKCPEQLTKYPFNIFWQRLQAVPGFQ